MSNDKITPAKPTTAIPELSAMALTENQYHVVAKVVAVSSRLETADLIPAHELTIRWRIEVAGAFLAALIHHARTAAKDTAAEDGLGDFETTLRKDSLIDAALDLAVKRAREIDRQGHA